MEDKAQQHPSFPNGATVPFPFETPYPQQTALMDALLKTLERKEMEDDANGSERNAAVMFLESPTGTGKSLSLACSAMAWLRHKERVDLQEEDAAKASCEKVPASIEEDDWISSWRPQEETERERQFHAARDRANSSRNRLRRHLQSIRGNQDISHQDRLRERRENMVRSAVTKTKMAERKSRRKKKPKATKPKQAKEDDFCVESYSSDIEPEAPYEIEPDENENLNDNSASCLLDGSNLDGSSATHGAIAVGGVHAGSGVRKIVYAARTHSQLSQFVSEVRRTHWGKDVRVVALGGRQVLCGNSTVNRKSRSEATISESCLDLQKDKASSCPLLASREAVSTLALHTLAHPSDIEDAAQLGQASHACGYYASRESLAAAEIVVLPYNMLLSQSTRNAIGLSLKQSLVLVDEAHNLPEAIRSVHSSRLSLPVTEAALEQLVAYTKKYATRLAGRNIYYLGQIRKCLNAFLGYLKSEPQHNRMMTASELLFELKLDNVNIFKLLRYLKTSRLPQKLLGFTNITKQRLEATNNEMTTASGLPSKHVSALSLVQTFLLKLTSTPQEGKFVFDRPNVNRSTEHPTLRFVLLHPAAHFENVLKEAFSVALVGGTLRPFAHVASELLGPEFVADAVQADKLVEQEDSDACFRTKSLAAFTCDHVVSSSNVLMECVSVGPSGVQLDFRHQSRKTDRVCDELGKSILGVCQQVPAGVVIFLPSYSYEAHLVRRWKKTGLWAELQQTKKLHREPKSSSDVESTLKSYSRDATGGRGALLLSVVGGKMSEGINFANDMARCVMVVGLPYPDITNPELKEKMHNMDTGRSGITGQAYYHDLCMRAVNQSVGRAIRHAKDYAAIVLLDARYRSDPRVARALPKWLRRGSHQQMARKEHGLENMSFETTLARIGSFFELRRGDARIAEQGFSRQ